MDTAGALGMQFLFDFIFPVLGQKWLPKKKDRIPPSAAVSIIKMRKLHPPRKTLDRTNILASVEKKKKKEEKRKIIDKKNKNRVSKV